ncbi:MAG: ribonuclease HII [Candidatus Omnitrophica bacterium]|nr:ribonuclease HII [Candidatus Omnitrophota bacterium]
MKMVVGLDEAGRGPLAGVVVACALHLNKEPPFVVKDSKSLSASMREEIFSWLIKGSVFGVGIASNQEIDKVNILEATFLAFNRAVKKLLSKSAKLKKAKFIVDGNHFRSDLKINYICQPKADVYVKEVSCASIVAKVVRDYLMKSVDFLYPQWNFSQHKGYPTAEHFSLIERYALTPFHRRSFSPCRKKG